MKSTVLTDLMRFPLTGVAVSEFIRLFPSDMTWLVQDLESLASHPSSALKSLLQEVAAKSFVELSTTQLCAALECIDQIVNLTAKVQGNDEMGIFIEDGDILTMVVTSRAGSV